MTIDQTSKAEKRIKIKINIINSNYNLKINTKFEILQENGLMQNAYPNKHYETMIGGQKIKNLREN